MQTFRECTKPSTLKSFGLYDWYQEMSDRMKNPKKYKKKTPEEKDAIMRKAKIGPYREWQFDQKRFNEIALECYNDRSDAMIMAGVTYLREKYPEYNYLSDEEVVIKGLHKILYQERIQKSKQTLQEYKELETSYYEESLL